MDINYWEVALRLLLAVLFGGIVGFERESHNRPAGFRTHILVCVGSALIMMLSAYGFANLTGGKYQVDPSRIAAQVITGIGFLGAGTILQQRGSIRGLTTAASLWVVSGIGLAVGIGFYGGAAMATLIVLISLLLLGRVDRAILSQRRVKSLRIRAKDRPGLMGRVAGILGDLKLNIRRIELMEETYEPAVGYEVINMEFLLVAPL
ncbi:MAG TPA: MgtC/SapB family protein, partial [Bacillota bacterium]|nr:MgtC/SapB family protein [Bacillota bacterium]